MAERQLCYADSFDEETDRYVGLRGGQVINDLEDANSPGLLVKPEVASQQLDAERVEPAPSTPPGGSGNDGVGPNPDRPTPEPEVPPDPRPTRFHGTVELDATFTGRDAGRIAEEVIAHLAGLVGSNVTVTLEIHAEIPDGAPAHVVRTVTENSRTLKFGSHGFERE